MDLPLELPSCKWISQTGSDVLDTLLWVAWHVRILSFSTTRISFGILCSLPLKFHGKSFVTCTFARRRILRDLPILEWVYVTSKTFKCSFVINTYVSVIMSLCNMSYLNCEFENQRLNIVICVGIFMFFVKYLSATFLKCQTNSPKVATCCDAFPKNCI